MASFNGALTAADDIRYRYNIPALRDTAADEPPLIGAEAWIELVEMLSRIGPRGEDAEADSWTRECLGAFDAFLAATWAMATKPPHKRPCRVFVSHQQADVVYAERIAWLANREGLDYWLDVHDPALRLANRWALPPLMKSILIASIIEMALLNCSHVISVQTANAAGSRWVPYEFGRAKQHLLRSTQAASWFDTGMSPVNLNDYLLLGICARSEAEVVRWLQSQQGTCLGTRPGSGFPEPAPLPN